MSELATDQELVAQCLHGETAALGVLVLRHRLTAIGVAYRICGDPMLAEDIAQDTFIRIWERLHTFRPDGNFRSWLCRIAANLTIDTLRRRKPTSDVEELPLPDQNIGPEHAALNSERARVVQAALMSLPLHSRSALVLREYEGLSYQEIADSLGIPLGTVKSRINDARRRLQVELKGWMEDENWTPLM